MLHRVLQWLRDKKNKRAIDKLIKRRNKYVEKELSKLNK